VVLQVECFVSIPNPRGSFKVKSEDEPFNQVRIGHFDKMGEAPDDLNGTYLAPIEIWNGIQENAIYIEMLGKQPDDEGADTLEDEQVVPSATVTFSRIQIKKERFPERFK
jgi:hypothetical protein